MKPTIFLQERDKYVAIKVGCGRRLNVGALEKSFSGTASGVLNARKRLIELLANSGENFRQRRGFVQALESELRSGGGAGYEGSVDFGDYETSLKYLKQHFVIKRCRCQGFNPLEAFSEEQAM
jgi:hypothetical protein